ncbi:MAG: hypothetical protein CM1200mP10_18320 [Candidatus Neomarinimicrobiota bacterium]|nr:MAG: hypothetical protein CM1200mP10_18320 [Candidatus Neomarinimicrobiota bacterium]
MQFHPQKYGYIADDPNGKQLGLIAVDQWWKGTKITLYYYVVNGNEAGEEKISKYFKNGLKIKIHPDRLCMNQKKTGNIQFGVFPMYSTLNLFQNMQKRIHPSTYPLRICSCYGKQRW